MKKNNKKELITGVLACLIAGVYIIYNTIGIRLAQKDIMHFMCTTIIVPALILIVYGMVVGKGKTLLQSLPQISMVSLIVFIASCFSMYYMYHTGVIFEMLQNTTTSGDVVLNINDSITLGTIVQQALIFLVCACIGSGVANKVSEILVKIKN